MRKWLKTTLLVAISASTPYMSAWESDATTELFIGYRQDNSRWSIKGPVEEGCPFQITNKVDEAHIFELGLAARSIVDCSYYVRGCVKGGWVLDGDFRHKFTRREHDRRSDFGTDNEVFRNSDLVDGRYTVDLNLGIGYPFYFCDCKMKFIPVVGYAYRSQNYRTEPARQFIQHGDRRRPRDDFDDQDFSSASFGGEGEGGHHHSRFEVENVLNDTKLVSRWWGPFLGIDLEYTPCMCWNIYANIEWHFAHFKGKRQSQTGIREFDNFNRSASDADGFHMGIGTSCDLSDCWAGGFYAYYDNWRASKRYRVGCEDGSNIRNGDHVRFKNKNHGFGVALTLGSAF